MSQTTEENTLRAGRICTVVVVSGLLLLAVALVFGQTIGHPFVNYDDPLHISENPSLAHGLTATGIGWAFTTTHGNFWYPLTWLSMLLDFQICGFEPWGYHLTNVLLHGDDSPAVLGSVADDGRSLAQCVCGGCVCRSSVARGVGRLGVPTERRSQRSVLDADVAGLWLVRPVCWRRPASGDRQVLHFGRSNRSSGFAVSYLVSVADVRALSVGRLALRHGTDGQAGAGDAAVCAAVVGLLAAGADGFP